MFETETIKKLAEENGVELNGLENIPHIVKAHPLFEFDGVEDPDLLKKLGIDPEDIYQADGIFNTAVFPDGRVEGLKIVSGQYQIVQHDHAILELYNSLPENFDLKRIDIGITPNGGRCFAKFTSGHSIEVKEGDTVEYQLLMQNSADTTKRLTLSGGAWRMVCSNGMVIPDNRIERVSSKKLHKNNLSLDAEIKAFMGTVDNSVESMGLWKEYTKKTISAPELEDIFTQLECGPKVQEELLELGLRGENTSVHNQLTNNKLAAWNLYNAFTQRITDSDAVESVKLEKGAKISRFFDEMVIQ